MIHIREIADDKTTISSTRWAFAIVIEFDIIMIAITILSYIVAHFIGKPFNNHFVSDVSLLLGTLTGIVTTSKALQGFEPHKDKPKCRVEESTIINFDEDTSNQR